jgi:membrane associated rhomboid family serine protease
VVTGSEAHENLLMFDQSDWSAESEPCRMNEKPAVSTLMILCILAFVAELSMGNAMIGWLGLWPLDLSHSGPLDGSNFHLWQIVSYAFLHGSLLHLALNLYALWLFGIPLEQRWGSSRFALFFLVCVIGAGLAHLVVAEGVSGQGGSGAPVIGASGGVFGVLLAFGLRYPNVQLMLLIPPMPVKAKWFVLGYGLIELFAGVTGTAGGIAHFAHLGGMLTGYLLLRGMTDRFP